MAFGDAIVETVLGKPTAPVDTDTNPNAIAEGAAVNTTVGITAQSTFANGNAGLDYSLSADSSGGGFKIDQNTGIVTVADPSKIDFESAPGHFYTITVRATKNNNFSSEQTFTISVNDVAPSTPVDSNAGGNTVLEGAANGTAVGVTASSTDVNGGAVTYSLTGDTSGGGFTINATTGVITVADGSKIDFESSAGHAYTVTVQSSDGTLTSSQAFTINVGDVTPTTPVDTNGAANSVAEGAANGTAVGITASAVDPSGPATTYSLTNNAGGRFAINATTGVVTVANGAAIDFETAPGNAYGITVQATSGATSTTQAFSIGVTDVGPSTPADANGAGNAVLEGAANGTAVGITAGSADPGGGPAPTFSLTDSAGGRFAINATTGVVTVANGAAIDFETAPAHAYNVTVQATAGSLSNTQTFAIGVGNVNEAPAGTNKAVVIAEDTPYTFSVADFGFTDPSDSSAPNSLQAVRITTLPGAGGGTLTNGGSPVNAGDFISAANIAAGLLVFTPVLNANGSPLGTFTFQVQDNGGTANGGVDLDQSANTFTINATAVNDAPVNSAPGAQGVNEEATLTFSSGTGNAITISDVDVGAGNETVTLTVTSGILALGSTAGLTSFTNNAASITLTGTVANINAALNGLTYTGNLNFNGADSLGISTSDNGNTGGGGTQSDNDSVAINVVAVNDAPAGTDKAVSIAEDTTYTFSVADFGFSDPSDSVAPNSLLAVRMTTVPGAGTGTLTNNGVTVNAGDSVSAANIAAGLLVFTPVLNANGSPLATFTFQVQDNGGTANSGVDLDQSANTFTINATPVNDAPLNSVPGTQGVNEEATLTFSSGTGNAITISDVDVGAGNETVTLSVAGGALTLNGTAGLAFTVGDGSADSTMTFSGTVAAINTALNGLTYTGNLNFNGADLLSVSTSDNGNTGGGGTQSDNDSVGINVVAVNDAPAGTDKAVLIAEDTTYTFSVADFGFSDPSDSLAPNSLLAVRMTTVPGTGTLTNNGVTVNAGDSVSAADIAAGLLVYTPVLDGNGSPLATFTFQVQDNGGTANSGVDLDQSANTFTINVNAGNDAPINSVPGTQSVIEEATLTFSTGNGNAITISDVDIGSGNATVTLSVTGGALTLNGTAGLAFSAGDGTADSTMSFSGTVGAINTALNGLTYTGNLNFAGADTLIVSTNDNGNTGNGGPQNDTDNITINVAGVNDAPVNGVQGTQTVNEDTTLVFSGANAISISDVDAGAGNETVTLSVASGALTLNGTAGLAFTVGDGTADSTMTFSGTVAAINAALNGLGYQGNLNFNGSDALNITTNDNGNTGSGGAQSDADSITINVSAVNDAPVNGVPGTQTVNEDTSMVFSGANAISISDVDVGAGNETVTLSVASGALTLNGTAGLAFTVGDGTADSTMTFSGTVAAINAALNGLGYQGNLNFNGSDTLNITTSDNGNTGSGGVQNDADSVTINVAAVNDAPVNGVPGAQGVNEEATLTFSTGNGNAISISDVDVGAGNETVTLSVAGGLLSLSGTTGLAFTAGDGAADSTMTFSGTVAAINAALNGLTYTGNLNFAGADTLNITTNDGGNTGSGGAQSDADGITINVAAVNDAPVNGVPGAQGVNEDTSLVFTGGNAITISDVDVGAGNETVTLSVTSGALTLNGTAGLAFSVGDGSADSTMTFSGTVAAINAALNGLGYQGNLNFNGSDTLNITTNDGGNTGSGGAQSDADSVAISVAAVNDAPTLAATGNNPNYVAGGVDLFSGVTATTGPANESSQLLSKLVLTATNVSGTASDFLTIDGTQVDLTDLNSLTTTGPLGVQASVSVTGGTATVTITSTAGLSAVDLQTLVDGLKYTDTVVNPGDPNHVVTLTSLQDNGGTTPGVDTATLNIMSTVTFNVAPTIVAGGTLNYTENDAATVIDATIDITDSDSANMTGAKVAITGGFDNTQDILDFTASGGIGGSYNPTTGELTLTGTASQAAYETVLGTVTYRNSSDNPSTAQRTINYIVNDGFVDSAAGTATINIAATNDVPVVTASGGSTAYIENAAAVTVDGSLTVTDPDSSITSAQVRISANFQAGDSLNFVDQNGITGSLAASVLTLSGTASVADYQAALRSITFSSTNNDPGVSKTVEFKVNDAVVDSNLATKTLAITPVNDEPTLTATANGSGNVTFIETSTPAFVGNGPLDLFSSPATSTVEVGQTLTQVVITVTNVADTTEFLTIGTTAVDLVNGNSEAVTLGAATGTASVSITGNTATITVTPTSTFSTANINTLVDNLAYNNNDNTPTATTHTISVTSLTDSGANGGANGDDNFGSPSVSTVVTVTPTNDGPVAVNDTFTGLNGAIVNTTLVVDGPTAGTADPDGVQKTITGNILANDSDVDGGPLTVVAGTFVTAEGGSVTLDTDGGFVYTPKPNTTGTPDTTDSFTYTVTDGNAVGQNGTATGTVTINFVPNSTIWYVDSSYNPMTHGASDGSSLRPFTDFTQLNGAGGAGDVDAANDTIFVYDGTYAGNLELEFGQKLFGERHGLTAPDGGGGAGVTTLLAANAGAGLTQINGTITANSNNSIQAISWGDSAGVSLTGTNVGELHVNDADAASAGSINNTTAAAVSINGSTALTNMQFTSVSSGAGASGISLTNVNGTFNAAGGTLSGHTTSEVGISGGTGSITYGGVIGDGTGLSASIAGRTGGSVTLSGNINDGTDVGGGISVSGNTGGTINFSGATKTLDTLTSNAVSLSSNGGATINFTGGGLDIDTSSGTGFSASVSGNYSVTGSGNSINATGGTALNLAFVTVDAGGLNFTTTTSGGGANNVSLNTVTGTGPVNLGTGALSGATGAGFVVSAGSGSIDYNGSITHTGNARAIDIQDHGSGTISFDGTVSSTSASDGIFLDDNDQGTGTTINFTNTLTLTTLASNSTGFTATNGGTVTATGSGSTISSGQGTALNVANTTIGAADLTFQSISSSGGSATGIILDTTGALGGLHVIGTGSAGSGGTIATKTGANGSTTTGVGIYANNTSELQLDRMQLNGFDNFAIRASDVNGFTLQNSVINGNNGNDAGSDEGAIFFANSSGTINITNSQISGGFEDNLRVLYDSATADTAIYNVTSSTFRDLQAAGQNAQVNLRSATTASAASNVTFNFGSTSNAALGNTFENDANTLPPGGTENWSDGILVTFEGPFQHTLNVDNNTFHHLFQALDMASNFSADVDYRVYSNDISFTEGVAAIAFGSGSSSTAASLIQALIEDNNIGTVAGGDNSGSRLGEGIVGDFRGAETARVTIHQNVILNTEVNGIRIISQATAGDGDVHLRVTNNTVDSIDDNEGGGAGVIYGIEVTTNAATNGDIFADIRGNDSDNVNAFDIRVRQATANNTFALEDFAGNGTVAAQVEAFLAAQNPLSTTNVRVGGSIVNYTSQNLNNTDTPAPLTPLLAADGGVQASSPTPGETHLTQAQLDSVVAAAIAQWAHAGASAAQLAALAAITFSVVDLSGNIIGDQTPGHIYIDSDAAGHGWFIDPTPNDNSEFTNAQNAAGTDLHADPSSAAAGHLDLLTAVTHELGHVLGLEDANAPNDTLMYANLVDGERRMPDAADVAQAAEADIPQISQAPAGTPIVAGNAANNIIDAGDGGSFLFGGAGADTFVFGTSIQLDGPAPSPLTYVADYSAAQGDTFDFSAITSAFHNSNVSDSLVVRAVEDASGKFAMLQVDHINPMGLPSAPNWVNVAQLDGAHAGDSVNVLIDNNHSVHLAQIHVDLLV